MDYEKQRAFLAQQRRRLVPAATGSGLLLIEVFRLAAPLWARMSAVLVALALLWAAYYLPNYLGLDAGPQRRPRWIARARWVVLILAGAAALAAHAKMTLVALAAAAILHSVLVRILRRPLLPDLREADPPRLARLALAYGTADLVWLGLARRDAVPGILLPAFVALSAFLAVLLLRPRSAAVQAGVGLAAATASYLLWPSAAGAIAVFVWATGVAHLYRGAVEQNRANYEDLVENLQAFVHEPRERIAPMLTEGTTRLAEDWHRSRPQGQAEVSAWYSRNSRLYLYVNTQHHLLYKHIVYTLGLLKLARGRVLDFGGGPGNFSRALARAGFDTTYLDVPGDSADYLRWRAAREGLRLKIVHEMDQLEGPYDVIFSLDVLEHLVDLKPVVAKWKQLLRPGGLLVATYYNGPNSSAPMHIDPGYDAKDYLLRQGFRDIKSRLVGLFSAELLRKRHFMILERQAT